MSFSFCFSPMRRAALFAPDSSFLAVVVFDAGNAFSFLVFVIVAASNALLLSGICDSRRRQCFLLSGICDTRCRQMLFSFLALWHSLQAMLFSFLPFVAFGTGEGLLRYGIRIRCSKQAPGVRDAFSEAFGAKNRRFRYRRDIRYQKPPFMVRTRTRRTGNGFLWPSTQLRLPGSQVFQPGSRRFRIILIP